MSSYFKFRQEELPVVGEILLQLFDRDRKVFEEFSGEYNDDFVTNTQKQIQKVKDLTQAPILSAEVKKITGELYYDLDQILPKLDHVAAYAQRANKALSVKASDFGVKEAKKAIRSRNVEGYCAKVKVVLQNIQNNLSALKEKGYKETLGVELETSTQKVYDLNLAQEEKIRTKKQLVADNTAEFVELWKLLSDISKTGKLVMKSDQLKSDQYMFSHILKQVRKPSAVVVEKKKNGETKVVPEKEAVAQD